MGLLLLISVFLLQFPIFLEVMSKIWTKTKMLKYTYVLLTDTESHFNQVII